MARGGAYNKQANEWIEATLALSMSLIKLFQLWIHVPEKAKLFQLWIIDLRTNFAITLDKENFLGGKFQFYPNSELKVA